MEQLRDQVCCIGPDGESTSISCNIEYEATWTVNLSKVIFEPKKTTKYLPKDSDDDFFVCLASPTICVTLHSPTKNFGRFA